MFKIITNIPFIFAGLPVPSVTWYHDGLPVGLASIDGRYQVLPHSSLRIHRLEEKDSGMLQCFAKNSAGEVQTHAHLTVRSELYTYEQTPAGIVIPLLFELLHNVITHI